MWVTVALLMILTPLGILAGGTAWGEWSVSDLANSGDRRATATSLPTQPALAEAPAGLQRLSTLWTAPIPNYAPQFVKSPSFGYLLSAMFGVGVVMAFSLVVQRHLQRRRAAGHLG